MIVYLNIWPVICHYLKSGCPASGKCEVSLGQALLWTQSSLETSEKLLTNADTWNPALNRSLLGERAITNQLPEPVTVEQFVVRDSKLAMTWLRSPFGEDEKFLLSACQGQKNNEHITCFVWSSKLCLVITCYLRTLKIYSSNSLEITLKNICNKFKMVCLVCRKLWKICHLFQIKLWIVYKVTCNKKEINWIILLLCGLKSIAESTACVPLDKIFKSDW